jgi:hypothetical protein
MPFRLQYIPSKKCYSVRKKKPKNKTKKQGRKVFSKCTTREKAIKQIRLLRAIIYNPKFKPYR